MNIQTYLSQCQNRVNTTLNKSLPKVNKEPKELHRAMRYAVLNGGKRIRSALSYGIGEALGANDAVMDACCSSIELVHSFSLIHDDLPAIDNDDLRRGKPSCHIAFDEATAILAGDALLALSFEVLAKLKTRSISPKTILEMIKILSHYIGSTGMAGGEALDTAIKDQDISLRKLAFIYKLKTSYLICASILLGALAANYDKQPVLKNLEKFGLYLGLAFQIHDDIIEIESDTEILGKPKCSDQINHKPTYPEIIGLKNAKRKENFCFDTAKKYLKKTGINTTTIFALSQYIIKREY